jgi:hypothetical protein
MRNIGKLLFIFILLGTVAFVGSNISAKENVRTASYRTEKPSSPIIEVSEAPFYEGHALRVKSVCKGSAGFIAHGRFLTQGRAYLPGA